MLGMGEGGVVLVKGEGGRGVGYGGRWSGVG